MSELDRLKKVISWLVFTGVASNDAELSKLAGYTRSSFSQIINGRVPLSDKFLLKLAAIAPTLNIAWIRSGVGEMLLVSGDKVEASNELEKLKNDYIALSKKYNLLRDELDELKRERNDFLNKSRSVEGSAEAV